MERLKRYVIYLLVISEGKKAQGPERDIQEHGEQMSHIKEAFKD